MFLNMLFVSSALVAVLSAFAVVFSKNIMHACVYLFMSLLGVAGLYVTLNADFVAATQLVVYVGGVVILMLFATMLTGGVSFQAHNKYGLKKSAMMGHGKSYTLGFVSACLFSLICVKLLSNLLRNKPVVATGAFTSTVEDIGVLLVTDHVLAFEISSVLLLGALVGAAMIARPRKESV